MAHKFFLLDLLQDSPIFLILGQSFSVELLSSPLPPRHVFTLVFLFLWLDWAGNPDKPVPMITCLYPVCPSHNRQKLCCMLRFEGLFLLTLMGSPEFDKTENRKKNGVLRIHYTLLVHPTDCTRYFYSDGTSFRHPLPWYLAPLPGYTYHYHSPLHGSVPYRTVTIKLTL